jgi:hypothetical protein
MIRDRVASGFRQQSLAKGVLLPPYLKNGTLKSAILSGNSTQSGSDGHQQGSVPQQAQLGSAVQIPVQSIILGHLQAPIVPQLLP